jgi:hypothetical protein
LVQNLYYTLNIGSWLFLDGFWVVGCFYLFSVQVDYFLGSQSKLYAAFVQTGMAEIGTTVFVRSTALHWRATDNAWANGNGHEEPSKVIGELNCGWNKRFYLKKQPANLLDMTKQQMCRLKPKWFRKGLTREIEASDTEARGGARFLSRDRRFFFFQGRFLLFVI